MTVQSDGTAARVGEMSALKNNAKMARNRMTTPTVNIVVGVNYRGILRFDFWLCQQRY